MLFVFRKKKMVETSHKVSKSEKIETSFGAMCIMTMLGRVDSMEIKRVRKVLHLGTSLVEVVCEYKTFL